MPAVGIRELKDRLSHYLRLVRQGQEIEITDRGQVVASLGPPRRTAPEGLPPGLVELARQGRARLGAQNRPEHVVMTSALTVVECDRALIRVVPPDEGVVSEVLARYHHG